MEKMKITVIGGGSSYAPELLDGLIKRWEQDEFHVEEVALVDVPEGKDRMETIAAFSRRMIAKRGMACRVTTSLDRRSAIDGARFVVSQLRVGQMKARWSDEHIPLKHGVIGQETTGPGGFANALRTIPVSLDIARDIKDVNPGSWLLNFTNPSGLVTEALQKYSDAKTFGLCNVPIGIKMGVAKGLTVDPGRVSVDASGLNHLVFVTGLYLDGKDVSSRLFDSPLLDAYLKAEKFGPEFAPYLRRLHAIPASYLYYFWFTSKALSSQVKDVASGKGTRADEVMRVEKELFEIYAKEDEVNLPPALKKRGGAYYSDVALNCMSAMVRNVPANEVLNVRNEGSVPGLEPNVVVEVSCMVDGRGAHPIAQKPLPVEVIGLVQQVKAYERLTVEAAVHGDLEAAFFALLNHPLVPGADAARAILNDILDENSEFLPQFKGKRV